MLQYLADFASVWNDSDAGGGEPSLFHSLVAQFSVGRRGEPDDHRHLPNESIFLVHWQHRIGSGAFLKIKEIYSCGGCVAFGAALQETLVERLLVASWKITVRTQRGST